MWRRVKTRTGGNAVLTLGPLAVPDAGPYDAIVPTPPSHSVADLQARLQSALGDAYHVEKELGGGGMSRVFLATEASLHRQVVIKLLPPELASEVSEARFRQEIELAAHLQHTNILPVLTAGARDDLLFYVMPFVTGESLRHRMTREGKLPVTDAVRVLHEIADALAYAHAEGVIHRDVKPENILLLGSHAVLTDFGVARALVEARSGGRLTDTGLALGTPGYMSPEQAAGERNIDARADVYALAVVGYEMLAGFPSFAGPTARAVIAAHLTATPKPLTDIRAEAPPDVANAIARALAKDPNARLGTAAEFRDAIAGAAAHRATRRIPTSWVLAAGVAVLAVIGAAALVLRPRASAPLDPNLVAVAPFDVLAPNLELWHEGFVDVLSRNLDGAGPLRTVSPTIVIHRWSGKADPASAAALSRSTGARVLVFGTLVGVGRDSVRATVTVRDVGSHSNIAEIDRRDAVDRMDRLGDSLTVDVLRELGRTRPIASVRLGALGSSSLPAIKLFLAGEQFYRRGQYDSALAYARRVVSIDSNFTLALRRISLSLWWGGRGAYESAMIREGRHNHGLAPRESLLVIADSLWGALQGGDGPPELYPLYQRLFRTLSEAVRRFPEDPEAWYHQGELAFHWGAWTKPQLTAQQALAAFDRAIALDSAFGPPFEHSVELAPRLRGTAAARRYLSAGLALHQAGREGAAAWLTSQLLDTDPARVRAVQSSLDTIPAGAFGGASYIFKAWPDSGETAVWVARAYAASRRGLTRDDSLLQRWVPAAALASRGHLHEASTALTPGASLLASVEQVAFLFAELALLNSIPRDTARFAFQRCLLAANLPCSWAALGRWAAVGDTGSLRDLAHRSDSIARSASSVTRDLWRYAAAATQPYLALARGDTVLAIRRFAGLPDSLCGNCYLDKLARVRLLAARGENREAEAVLDQVLHNHDFVSALDGMWALEGGRVYERLGQREKAIANYGFVVDVWRHADPQLQPYVEEARAALKRLGGEPR